MNIEQSHERLLAGGENVELHWKQFLREHTRLMLKIIWQFDNDYDGVMEKYLYVCSKLAAGNFAILRRFTQQHHANPPRFTTWLGTVTYNLCVDAYRSSHGRRQFPRAVLGLPALDREVFQLYYWKGYSREEIEHTLSNKFKHDGLSIMESLQRVEEVIAGLSTTVDRRPVFLPFNENDSPVGMSENTTDFNEMLEWLDRWMDELNDQERMIIRLRFWEGMTGPEIADAMGISPTQRVYPLLQKALSSLRERALQTYSKTSGGLSV